MTDKKGVQFKRNVQNLGSSYAITIPKELCEYLELKKGDTLILQDDNGSKGKFVSFWKENE